MIRRASSKPLEIEELHSTMSAWFIFQLMAETTQEKKRNMSKHWANNDCFSTGLEADKYEAGCATFSLPHAAHDQQWIARAVYKTWLGELSIGYFASRKLQDMCGSSFFSKAQYYCCALYD